MDVKKWVAGRIKNYKDWDKYTFDFGKHKGSPIWEVFDSDPQYFQWVFLNARHRLNPQLDNFIRANHHHINDARLKQEEAEKNMFAGVSFESEVPASKPD